MPLYNLHRDSGFLKGINKEIVQKIISTEVGIYKIDLESTDSNIYGETSKKIFRTPIRMYAVITPGTKDQSDTDDLISYSKIMNFAFIKSELKEKELYLEVGDYLYYDEKYFEIDKVSTSQYWSGRNPNSAIGIKQDNWSIYGYDYGVTVEAHLTSDPIFQ